METNRYTVIVFTENQIGLLSQISNIFTRRNLGIWSLSALPTDIKGIHSLTIVVDGGAKKVEEARLQIEKRVDVLKAYGFLSEKIVSQELIIHERLKEEVRAFIAHRESIRPVSNQ